MRRFAALAPCLAITTAFTVAACAPVEPVPPATPPSPAPAVTGAPAATAPAAPAADAGALEGRRWTLETATDARGARIAALFPPGAVLALEFADGRVSATGACNRMSGTYRIAGDTLRIGPLATTKMACKGPLMAAEAAFAALLAQPQVHAVRAGAPPRLELRAPDGAASAWTGVATPATRFGGPGERVFLEVAPQRVACSHPMMPDHRCLQVREIAYDDAGRKQAPGQWRPLYGEIEGFTFVEGTRNVLRLEKFRRKDAPADASAAVYVLDMVVESEDMR